ncbi:MAG: biotin transporter BioY, partial [Anaerolineales bacterium]|nr:biotin transporter BioY [Anaerolineales bacterium]
MTLTTLFHPAEKKAALIYQFSLILAGSWLIALAAQISIPLPFSPVPITGQTFAVLLVGALLGRRLAGLSVAAYLA